MDRTEWLAGLKVGDEVAERQYNSNIVTTVERTTSKMIMFEGKRFWRESGMEVGRGEEWGGRNLYPVTDEIREEIERREIDNNIDRFAEKGKKMYPLAKLRALRALIDEIEKGNEDVGKS